MVGSGRNRILEICLLTRGLDKLSHQCANRRLGMTRVLSERRRLILYNTQTICKIQTITTRWWLYKSYVGGTLGGQPQGALAFLPMTISLNERTALRRSNKKFFIFSLVTTKLGMWLTLMLFVTLHTPSNKDHKNTSPKYLPI